jgi:hypothetical protein
MVDEETARGHSRRMVFRGQHGRRVGHRADAAVGQGQRQVRKAKKGRRAVLAVAVCVVAGAAFAIWHGHVQWAEWGLVGGMVVALAIGLFADTVAGEPPEQPMR